LVPYKYTYLVYSLIFVVPWILFFFKRKDLRNEMIFSSILIAVLSIATAYLWWTVDWWRPETITGTIVGIEDILLGFTTGGIAAVAYEELFRRKLYKTKIKNPKVEFLFILFLISILICLLTWMFGLLSWVASSVAMIIGIVVLFFLRRDLTINALASGFFLMLATLPAYFLVMIVSPGWIERTWLFENLTGKLFIGIPIEDVIFYFLMGFLVGPMYEVWMGDKLKRI